LEDLSVEGRITLKQNMKENARKLVRLMWLTIETNGEV
jgi:phenylalanine-4-hydroxylase